MGRHAESETFVITIYLLAFYAFVAPEICGWLIYERLKFDGGGCRDRYLKVEEIFEGITPTVKRIVVPFLKTIDEPVTRDVKMTVFFSCGLSNEPRSKLPTAWQITSSAIANGE